jgi:serine/threonine protein kinase
MTRWIGDAAIAHLRDVADWPDLGERYDVIRRVGRGGMGVVYAAHDRTLRREVAIKVIDGLPQSEDAAERLLAEAETLARLEHPGIVPVHDTGVLPDGRRYYAMKLVRGQRLDAVLDARSLHERLELFVRICDAVAFAHAHGVVHRDLKPENIMLGSFGEVLVMDWGVAQRAGAGVDDGAVVGTPGYMAPEQERRAASVDARADVFALGVILEAMVPQAAAKPLRAIAAKARSARADDRYGSVSGLAADIGRFREGEPVSAYQESVLEKLGRVYQRHKLPITLMLVYMVVRVIVLLWFGT